MITVLKFHAKWCVPCLELEPVWKQLQENLKDQFIFQNIDVDDNPQLRAEYFVRTIPTIILVKDGKQISVRAGGGTLNELTNWLLNEQGNL